MIRGVQEFLERFLYVNKEGKKNVKETYFKRLTVLFDK